MTSRTRHWLVNGLKIVGGLLLAGAAVFAFFGVRLIVEGVFPPDGNGSLGHVGMVIGGIIGCFLALIGALLGLWAFWKSRRLAAGSTPPAVPGTSAPTAL